MLSKVWIELHVSFIIIFVILYSLCEKSFENLVRPVTVDALVS